MKDTLKKKKKSPERVSESHRPQVAGKLIVQMIDSLADPHHRD